VTENLFDDVVVVGRYEQCIARLTDLVASGVDTLVITPVVAGEDNSALEFVMGTLPMIADDVLRAAAS
jgi:alkanesulfonate monooxygenase SsuD/methylene tetrahydromethanopterin reductase-like flavin-dependent oxidoreductase (luciferase family)